MLFNKEQLVLTLQEKAHEKIEQLRHEMAQAMFDALTEETFFVFDKKAEDVVGGPFASKAKAQSFVKEMDSKDLVIMTEKALEKKMGVKEESSIDEMSPEEFKKGAKDPADMTDEELQKHLAKKIENPGSATWRKLIKKEIARRQQKKSVKGESIDEALGSEAPLQLKDMDAVLNWFADHNYLDQEFEFDNETGVLTMNGKAVATKGKDGSYSVDVTACGNVGLKK